MNVRSRSRKLLLAALLTTSGVSTSGIAAIAAPGMSSTVAVSSVPGLAQALGLVPVKQSHSHRKSKILPARRNTPITAIAPTRVSLVVGKNPTAQELSLGAVNLLAGSSVTRYLDITNTGNIPLVALTIGVSASPVVQLVSSASQGAQLIISQCSVPWTGSICKGQSIHGGTWPLMVATDGGMAIPNIINGAPGETDYLAVVFSLPASSTLANEKTMLTWIIVGTGR